MSETAGLLDPAHEPPPAPARHYVDLAGAWQIGAGLQYTVYDLGNGRVFKRPATNWESYTRMLAWRFPFREVRPWKLGDEVRRMRADAVRSLQQIQPLLPKVARSLGNPAIYPQGCYEQDRATVLEDYFRNHSLRENKAVVDRYIALLFHLWGQGFSDGPFKFTLNFGIGRDGGIILLDLGELYFDRQRALERVRSRVWERTQILDAALGAYYRSAMDAAMTAANVERYWRAAP